MVQWVQQCPLTVGFQGSADVSAVSLLSSGKLTVGYGIQLTALLSNLASVVSVPGNVEFYWVPNDWSAGSGTLPLPAVDATTGCNWATAIGPGGALSIPEGNRFPATVCWVPAAAQSGKGQILVRAISLGDGTCVVPFTPPLDGNLPGCVLSGVIHIFPGT